MSCSLSEPVIRKDSIFGRWVIFSPARSRRPSDFKSKSPSNPSTHSTSCPFCIGRESECAPELWRVPPSTPNWRIRLIENLFPALNRELDVGGGMEVKRGGMEVKGFGFHDVVIETPEHGVRLWDMEPEEVRDVLLVYVERVKQLESLGSIKYVQVFKNHGAAAGASMTHSHSQIIGLPIIPPSVTTRLDCTKGVFDRTGKCGLCEVKKDGFLINETDQFYAIAPFAASYPFEIWIVPKEHCSYFHRLDSNQALDLGRLLKQMLSKISNQLNDPPFNFMIHSAPFDLSPDCSKHMHWFLQIIPHLGSIAGFELGSGCYINPVFPEDSAQILREIQ